MEQNTQQTQELQVQQPLPNAVGTLVLGILSIVFSCCYGIFGLVLGIIALAISGKSVKLYKENPEKWTGYSNLNAGRITAIIGISLSALLVVFFVVYIFFVVGLAAFSLNDLMNEFY